MSRDEILTQALGLSAEDRAYVASMLENSLRSQTGRDGLNASAEGGDAVTGDDLLEELHRRSAEYRSGATTSRTAADVIADLKRRQENEIAP